jgi:hypothetical protein
MASATSSASVFDVSRRSSAGRAVFTRDPAFPDEVPPELWLPFDDPVDKPKDAQPTHNAASIHNTKIFFITSSSTLRIDD